MRPVTSYYVDPAGDDLAAGTSIATAWKTLERATLQPLTSASAMTFGGTATNPLRGQYYTRGDGATYGAISGHGVICASYDVTDGQTSNAGEFVAIPGAPSSADLWMQTWTSSTNLTNWTETITGSSTLTQDATHQIFGTNCGAVVIDGAGSVVVLKQANLTLIKDAKYTIDFLVRAASGTPNLKWRIKNINASQYLQSNGTWSAVSNIFSTTCPANWQFTSSIEFIPTSTSGFDIEIRLDTASATYYAQGFRLKQKASWILDSGTTYRLPIQYINNVPALSKCAATDWATLGVDALVFSRNAASLAAIAEGQHFFDTAAKLLYYKLAAGETLASVHFELHKLAYGMQIGHANIIAHDIYIYAARHGCWRSNNASSFAATNMKYRHSWIFGAEDNGSSTGTHTTCEANNNNTLAAEIYASNGFNADGTTVITYDRCASHHNGDDGFENAPTNTITLKACLAYRNGGSQITVQGPVNVYNCTFLSDTALSDGTAAIQDKAASGAIRIYKNNITYYLRSLAGVTILNTNGVTGANNLWYEPNASNHTGNVANYSSGGVANADPLFVAVAQDDDRITLASPAKGAGVAVAGMTTDYAGNTYASPPSIGAYEYVAT